MMKENTREKKKVLEDLYQLGDSEHGV